MRNQFTILAIFSLIFLTGCFENDTAPKVITLKNGTKVYSQLIWSKPHSQNGPNLIGHTYKGTLDAEKHVELAQTYFGDIVKYSEQGRYTTYTFKTIEANEVYKIEKFFKDFNMESYLGDGKSPRLWKFERYHKDQGIMLMIDRSLPYYGVYLVVESFYGANATEDGIFLVPNNDGNLESGSVFIMGTFNFK